MILPFLPEFTPHFISNLIILIGFMGFFGFIGVLANIANDYNGNREDIFIGLISIILSFTKNIPSTE